MDPVLKQTLLYSNESIVSFYTKHNNFIALICSSVFNAQCIDLVVNKQQNLKKINEEIE